jgi:hypothetical protein
MAVNYMEDGTKTEAAADQRLPQGRHRHHRRRATRWCCRTSPPRSSRARPRLALIIGKTRDAA